MFLLLSALSWAQSTPDLPTNADFRAGAAALEQILEKAPGNVQAWVNLGIAQLQLGELEKAHRTLSFSLEADPKNAVAMNAIAVVHLKAGRYDQGITALTDAFMLDYSYLSPLMNLAAISEQIQDPLASISFYRLALEVEPGHAQAAARLARILNIGNRQDQAHIVLETARMMHPENVELLLQKGLAHQGQQQDLVALQFLLKAVALDPAYLDATRAAAFSLLRTEQWPAAEALYLTALEMAGTHPIVIEIHYELAQVYAFSGADIPRALEHLAFNIKADPANSAAYSFQGNLQEDLGDVSAAIRSWTQAIRLNKSNCEALNNLGRVRMNQGDLDEARTLFSRCLNAQSSYSPALLNRGAMRVAEGDCEGAREDLSELILQESPLGEMARQVGSVCD
jgi:tetratricopeptide (TPR) repeat protein